MEGLKAHLRSVVHELRTPLCTAQIGLKLLKKDLRQSEADATVNGAYISCTWALDLVNEILLYDKLKEGNLAMANAVVSVWRMVERTVQPFLIQVSFYNH